MSLNKDHSSPHTNAYTAVWIVLLILTFITVEVSYHDYGTWNIAIAMLVATIKGSLVCLYFMHLKYDNRVNQVIFISAFLFLAIFVGLTASDELFRSGDLQPAKVHEIKGPTGGGEQAKKMKELLQSTPEQVAHGKEVFQTNCVACHGLNGQGNGPAAGALNPKPRNFTSAEGWKNGRAPSQIFKTITDGISGTPMPGFSTLSLEDRWAMTHYVYSLTPDPVSDTPQTLAAIGIQEGANAKGVAPQESIELPIPFAMERLIQEAKK